MPIDTRNYAPFPQQYWELMEEAFTEPIQETIVGRKIANVAGPFGEDKEMLTFRKYTEVSAATIAMNLSAGSRDLIKPSESSINVPYVFKNWFYSARQLMQIQKMGAAFDTGVIRSAGYEVGLQEDALILDGWKPDGTTYVGGVSGFLASAGLTKAGADFGTVDNARKTVGDCITEFEATAKISQGPWNWVLNYTNHGQLNGNFYTTTPAALWEMDVVQRKLGGQIFGTAVYSDGTGLMSTSPATGYFDIAIGADVTQKIEELDMHEGGGAVGFIYECLVPRVKQPNGLLKITGI